MTFVCRSLFSGEVWSSLSEEPQKIVGEPLSENASVTVLNFTNIFADGSRPDVSVLFGIGSLSRASPRSGKIEG